MSEPDSQSKVPPPVPMVVPPVPAIPLPVQPLSELAHENRYQAEGYETFRRRPGIVTAIAIVSITVGSLGLLSGGLSALYGGIFYFIAKTTAAMTATQNAAQVAAPQPPTISEETTADANGLPIVAERGLDPPARQIILDVLARRRPLSDSRRRQLHALLAKAGRDMFLSGGGEVAAADVRRAVTASGQLPSASDLDSNAGPDFFMIPTGRIEVYEDRALFEPSDRSQETVRVSAAPPSTEIAVANAAIQGQTQANSTATAQTTIVYSSPTTSPAPINAFAAGTGRLAVSGAAASTVVAEGAISVLLSVYLLVIGILTLKQNSRGRRLHIIYALMKIPLAVVCGVGWCWLAGGFFSAMNTNGGATQIQTVRAFLLILMTGAAMIYPIGLIITFCTPTVKQYYDSGAS